jgi:phosphoglycerate dehydrogenase-like enzyme
MSHVPRVLTHISARLLEPVRQAHPDVEIVSIPTDAPLEDGVEGDVLLTYTFGVPNLDQALERGVRWVHAFGTGVNGFPFEKLGDRAMTCSRGASAHAISEWVIAVMLAAEKLLPQSWISEPPERWNLARLGTLDGKKLALVGFGAIAKALARRALPFGMEIQALRRSGATSEGTDVLIVSTLEALLDDADHVVVAAPETPATHHMFDDATFALMKPGVHFVNIARGGLVDQEALRRALDSERVGLASLDCVDPEPLPEGHWLYTHPAVRLSPHISWAAPGSYEGLVGRFAENLGRYRRGETLVGQVDPDEGY